MKKGDRFFTRTLLVVAAIALVLRVVLVFLAAGMERAPDEEQYVFGGRAIARTGVPRYPNPNWDEAHSSPVYPYLMGGAFLLFDGPRAVTAVKLLQAFLGTGTVLLVYAVGRRAFDRRTALAAAAAAAVYPALVAFTHYIYAETIYTFLLMLVATILIGGRPSPSARRVFLAGLVAGAATLTRSVFLATVPFLAAWVFITGVDRRRDGMKRVAILLAGILVVIAPWTVRNALRYDGFLLIDSNTGNVLYKNLNVLRQENHDIGMGTRWREDAAGWRGKIPLRPRVEIENIPCRNAAEVKRALLFVGRHPVIYIRNCAVRAAELVNPTSFLVKAIRRGYYPDLPPVVGEVLVILSLLLTMTVLLAGFAGILTAPRSTAVLLAILLIAANLLLGVLVVSMSRYRLPIMPLMLLFAADFLLRGRRLLFSPGNGRRKAAIVLVALFLLASWIRYVPYSFPR